MSVSILTNNPQMCERIEQCLRDGLSPRAIERVLGVSHMTVRRYAQGRRVESPREILEPSSEMLAAKRRLDIAFNHFDNYRDRVSYDAWVEAQRDYESLRGPRHAN